ncbi:MAG: hypothetical protein RIB46_09725 [Pseudomonadales bacterium]
MTDRARSTAACLAALLLGGCAGLHSPCLEATVAADGSPADEPLSFSVSGERRNGGEACFLRLEVGYPEEPPAQVVVLDLEFEQRTADGWIGISWMEGLETEIPGPDRVGKPFRGEPHWAEVMHYALMDELLVRCEQLRARVTVTACEPGPCPPLRVDDRDGLFPLEVVHDSAP